jgi:hypothetical protein
MSKRMDHSPPYVPISWGELIDKITILEIKVARLTQASARANAKRELELLNVLASRVSPLVSAELDSLRVVNDILWQAEDLIRALEIRKSFGAEFVEVARSIYHNNDKRASFKRDINRILKSEMVEEKEYKPPTQAKSGQ